VNYFLKPHEQYLELVWTILRHANIFKTLHFFELHEHFVQCCEQKFKSCVFLNCLKILFNYTNIFIDLAFLLIVRTFFKAHEHFRNLAIFRIVGANLQCREENFKPCDFLNCLNNLCTICTFVRLMDILKPCDFFNCMCI
jgi:hypothetical protein